jgi:hypothetical protein
MDVEPGGDRESRPALLDLGHARFRRYEELKGDELVVSIEGGCFDCKRLPTSK